MGLYAGEQLALEVPRNDKRLRVLVEIDGCFADGVSVATGCWLGRRTLHVVGHGKQAAIFVDADAGRAVRLIPHESIRARALAAALSAPSPWHAYLAAYQQLRASELFAVEWVRLRAPLPRTADRQQTHVVCGVCHEEIFDGREVQRGRQAVRRACAGNVHYERIDVH
jgi:formylmethanofuran dehydrogenase subunit E